MLSTSRLDKYLQSKKIAGAEAVLQPDGKVLWNLVVLGKNKSAVDTESSISAIENTENLRLNIPDKIPVALVVNGKGIIHKKVFVNESDTDKSILQKVLPNANPDDFYFQKTATVNKSVFVSIVRKGIIETLLNDLLTQNISIVSCSLGPFIVSPVLPLLDDKPARFDLNIGTHFLQINENSIEEYSGGQPEDLSQIKLSGTLISSGLIIPFAAAFSYLIGDDSLSNNITPVEESRNAFQQKQKFQLLGWGVLVFFLSVLMINYFVFNHYWTKKNELGSKVSLNQAALTKYEKLNKEFEEKKQFLEKTGMLETSRTSYYADRLAVDLPNTIQLTVLHVNPVVKKVKLEEGISFTPKTINVEGVSRRSNELNNWIKIIKKKSWVEEVALLNYSQDQSKVTGEFSLEIRIK